jgi:hypothetical protein
MTVDGKWHPVECGFYRRMRLFNWLRNRLSPRSRLPLEWQRAHDVVKAVDAGGMPLHPARINQIARDLGLDVDTRAPVEVTVERLRRLLRERAQ